MKFKILHIIRSNLNNNTHKISKQILMYNQSYKQICEKWGDRKYSYGTQNQDI